MIDELKRLETLVDGLYDGQITLEKGKATFSGLTQGSQLPQDILQSVEKANTPDKLGDILDEVGESAKINKGREELERIKEKYTSQKKEWQSKPKTDSSHAIRSDFTVKAVLEVQKLVSAGVIPMEFLDFGDLELQYQPDDYDDEEDDDK